MRRLVALSVMLSRARYTCFAGHQQTLGILRKLCGYNLHRNLFAGNKVLSCEDNPHSSGTYLPR